MTTKFSLKKSPERSLQPIELSWLGSNPGLDQFKWLTLEKMLFSFLSHSSTEMLSTSSSKICSLISPTIPRLAWMWGCEAMTSERQYFGDLWPPDEWCLDLWFKLLTVASAILYSIVVEIWVFLIRHLRWNVILYAVWKWTKEYQALSSIFGTDCPYWFK